MIFYDKRIKYYEGKYNTKGNALEKSSKNTSMIPGSQGELENPPILFNIIRW
jgi:hypothetical protein